MPVKPKIISLTPAEAGQNTVKQREYNPDTSLPALAARGFYSSGKRAANQSGDIWVSSKVAPMGMVKLVDKNDTTVLVKTFSDAKTHLTGNPVKLDLQQMMMMNRGMQQQP